MRDKKPPKDLVVRRLYAGHQEDICDHFLRLDVQTRRARFFGAANNSGILKYVQNILWYDSVICGAFVAGQLRGLVELRGLIHSRPSTAEAAFSVEPRWQNNGIGDALFERMLAIAQNRGVRIIQMMCLKDNRRMQRLASKHHARLLANRDVVEAVLHVNWPTPGSIAKEIIRETRGYSHMFNG